MMILLWWIIGVSITLWLGILFVVHFYVDTVDFEFAMWILLFSFITILTSPLLLVIFLEQKIKKLIDPIIRKFK